MNEEIFNPFDIVFNDDEEEVVTTAIINHHLPEEEPQYDEETGLELYYDEESGKWKNRWIKGNVRIFPCVLRREKFSF